MVVALKTLHQNLWQNNVAALYRFKQEFRALADVHHPNLVTLYELFSDGELWFFTMELINGVNFLDYVRSDINHALANTPTLKDTKQDIARKSESLQFAPTLRSDDVSAASYGSAANYPEIPAHDLYLSVEQLNVQRLRDALKQLAEGVCALHEAGKLHRDLKPSNVMVTSEGRVVILDFGLVAELAEKTDKMDGLVGTPAYMSPEQAACRPVSPATDWYSFGVIIYEALTGRLPFTGKLSEILTRKESYTPPSPSTLVPGLPPDLDILCQLLMSHKPEERPHGSAVLAQLMAGENSAVPVARTTTGSARALPLVGRERHLNLLREAFATSRAGQAVTIFVHGQSGMGKSLLIRHFLDVIRSSQKDTVVLTGRCYELESVPYKAFDDLIDSLSQYLNRLSPAQAEMIMPRDVMALARLFPVLRQVEAVSGARREVLDIPDSQELRRRAFVALRELFARMAAQTPLVLFIDDLQWGDLDSASLMEELLRPPDTPALLLIGSYRSDEADTSPMLQMMLSGANDRQELVVGELNTEESIELILSLTHHKVSRAKAEAMARESAGNPFFIDELVRSIQQGVVEEANGDADSAVTKLEALIQTRVARLPLEARRLIEVLSVAGKPHHLAVVRSIVELGTREQDLLAVLRKGHLIRTRGKHEQETIELYHDRIRETVIATLSEAELKAHHNSLALALESAAYPDAEALMVHFQGAGNNEAAAKYAVIAADNAADALAFDHAANLYRLAIQLKPQFGEGALLVKLGNALTNAGRGAEASKAYLLAAAHTQGNEAIELLRRAAEQLLRSGYIDDGLTILERVLSMLGLKLASTPMTAIISLLARRLQIWVRGLGFRARSETELSPSQLNLIDTCWSIAVGLGQVDPIKGAAFQTRHLLFALNAGEPYRIVRALVFEAGYCSASGGSGYKRTRMFLDRARELAEQIKHPHALGLTVLADGHAAFQIGQWQTTVDLCDRATETIRAQCTGVTWELDTSQYYSLCALQHMGKLNEVYDRLPALLKEAKEHSDLYAETLLRTRYSSIGYILRDEPEQALEEIRQAMARWSQKGFHHQHYLEISGRMKITLYKDYGQGRAAWDYINECWPLLRRSLFLLVQVVRIEATHLRACSALAAAHNAGDVSPWLKAATGDAKRLEGEKMDWAVPLAKLVRAGAATYRGDRGSALKLLVKAEEGFHQVDMYLFAAAARYRRGQLLGGDEGRTLITEGEAYLTGQHIKNPARMVAMLAPGKWPN